MTYIRQLTIQNFRNCQHLSGQFSSGLNLIIGDNASGKTSIIEAIWFLATGRSFRSAQVKHLIQHQHTSLTVFTEVHTKQKTYRLGIQKHPKKTQLRINGQPVNTQSIVAQHLPVQLLTPESHKLLEDGPKTRRQFIDWGCFHQSEDFMPLWRTYQRTLKQRNQALKQQLPKAQIQLWDAPLIESAFKIDQFRQNYLEQLTPYLIQFCQALMPEISEHIICQYQSGWPKNTPDLALLYTHNFHKDLSAGYTQYGVHRADVRFKFSGQEAIHILSRGQQKLFVCALLLAQASLHENLQKEPVIMLIDDLPAELDTTHRLKLLELLQSLNIQHIITATSDTLIPIISPQTTQRWKLSNGHLTPYPSSKKNCVST